MIVEMRRIPKPNPAPEDRVSSGGKVRDPVVECASYGLPLVRGLKYLPGWRLVRKAPENGPDPFLQWQYDVRPKGDGREFLDQLLLKVEVIVGQLPADVVALELSARMVLAYWLEKPGSTEENVPSLAADLRAFAESIGALETEIEAARTSNDS